MPDTSTWDYNGTPWYKSAPLIGVMVMGIIESLFLYIQFAKTIVSEDASGLSIVAFMLFLFTSIGWMMWASLAKDAALLATSTCNMIGASLVVFSIYMYGGETYDPEPVTLERNDVPVRSYDEKARGQNKPQKFIAK